ncbi:MAG: WD40 repeat domain-containing protein, partial [Burkholderiales bacterium]
MPETPPPFCPYVGLRPFHEEDRAYFFGREHEVRQVVDNLFGARVTVFYGASGAGKSSVLMAGVLPELRKEPNTAVVVFRSWQIANALGALKRGVVAAANEVATRDLALDESLPLDELLKLAAERIDGTVLLILDQFEEFFLYFKDPDSGFDAELGRAINRRDVDAGFLISLREDSLSKLDRFKKRVPALLANTLRLSHLDAGAAKLAILKPLDEYNRCRPEAAGRPVRVEPALVEAVLEQTIPGRLSIAATGGAEVEAGRVEAPYLQLVLERLWNAEVGSGSRELRLSTLVRLGGAETIVRRHVDQVLEELDPRDQELCARLFDRLVTPSGAKIACTLKDLGKWAGDLASEVPRITKFFDHNRILARIAAPPGSPEDQDQYQLFHDVLAAGVLDWRSRYIEARTLAEAQAEAAHQRQEAERERKRTKAAHRMTALVGVLCALALAAFGWALQKEHEATEASARAEQAAREALAGQLAADSGLRLADDPDRAQLLAVESYATARVPAADAALRIAFDAFPDLSATLPSHTQRARYVAFSPDGKLIVTANDDGTVSLWGVGGSRPHELQGHGGKMKHTAFSPDGKLVLTVSTGGTVRLWNATGDLLKEHKGLGDPVDNAAVSPDGKLIVTAGDGTARLWDAAGNLIKNLEGHSRGVTHIAFSPDGKRIVTASWDGTARLWDTTGDLLHDLKGHGAALTHAAFSPDGNLLVTASWDGTARLWDAAGHPLKELKHGGAVKHAVFSSDGNRIVTASNDRTARLWDAAGNLLKKLEGHSRNVNYAAFSPNGRLIATASDDRTARLWDASG